MAGLAFVSGAVAVGMGPTLRRRFAPLPVLLLVATVLLAAPRAARLL